MKKIKYNEKEYEFEGKSILDFVKSINSNALVAKLNGKLVDLTTTLPSTCELELFDFSTDLGKKTFWHTSAHVLAQAIMRVKPDAKLTIGPAIDNGFYYDVDAEFTEDDYKKIEKEMKAIIHENIPIVREEISYEKAKELFKDNPYKLELVEEYKSSGLSIYRQGDFFDLCRGPHLPSTGYIKAIKIVKVSGAYWRGDAKNKMLQRIYGISFPTKEEMNDYLRMIEEAKKRDHRKIGQDLDLFSFHEEGPGFIFWHHKGMVLRNILIDFWRFQHYADGYQEVSTPIILNKELWVRSGHWDHYKNNMYFTKIDDQDYAVKPMNCPGGILIYKSRPRSYKEFPLKLGELGLVHRHELSGVLHGLMRVRAFTQDDAHIFCEPKDIKEQIKGVLKLIKETYNLFGFPFSIEISTRPDDKIGSDDLWDTAENALMEVCKEAGLEYKINEGDGAFYGPKIDVHIKDSLGRDWQCATVQLDFFMPQRFELKYMGEDGTYDHVPVMIHRVIYGSLERFIGILLEHYAGKLPLWLSPVQVKILSVSDDFVDKAKKIGMKLQQNGFRIEYDFRSESIGKKVRSAQLEKVNYVLVIGEKDSESDLAVRDRDGKVKHYSLSEFIDAMKEEIKAPFRKIGYDYPRI